MDRRGGSEPAALLSRELLTVEDYRAELLAQLASLGLGVRTERVPVAEAHGRVLAAPVVARVDVPAFDNSGMDGYAVRAADIAALPARLRVVADLPAGSGEDPALGASECARIMTGGAVPSDADTIVPIEQTAEFHEAGADRGWVTVLEAPGPGSFVRARGTSLSVGAELAPEGTRLTPGVLAAAIAAGAGEVTVAERPRVAIASTGDELVAPGDPLARGQIHDVNSVMLAARAESLGARATRLPALPDDDTAFAAGIAQAARTHDLVVVSGGASVGDHDVARNVLAARPVSAFRHVRMQPGKPQGWAHWDGALVIGLPGNPLSAAVSFEMFVAPVVDALLGARPASPRPGPRARARAAWASPAGRRQLVPATIDTAGDEARVEPVHAHGSASHLTTVLAGAQVLAVVPEETTHVDEGDWLETVWLR